MEEKEALDQLLDLFASDTLLHSQFVAMRQSVDPSWRPFQRLFVAVLADALDCVINLADAHPDSRRGRLHAEAQAWLFNERAEEAFSFSWLCDALGLHASHLRNGVGRLKHKMIRKAVI